MGIQVRRAAVANVSQIASLVEKHSRRGEILPRSSEAIAASIDDWLVAVEGEVVVGCGSLVDYTSTLSELRSLAIDDRMKRRGLGTELAKALITEASERGIQTLFALTRAPRFFEQVGFQVREEQPFPEKVWRDCWQCPIKDHCDEVPVVLQLDGSAGRAAVDGEF